VGKESKGAVKPAWRAFLPLLALTWPGAVFADRGDGYLQKLVQRARQAGLADRPSWRTLLHYKPGLLARGVRSLVDSPRFFNSPAGKVNPQAELEATLAAFFLPASAEKPDEHPQCRFIARYGWLKDELRFDPRRLPEQPCLRFRNWFQDLSPSALTLIFATAYLDNPASMFGHTLLRVDGKAGDLHDPLLSYAINYAAATGGEEFGISYALKGLFGGYPGQFFLAPYYQMVKTYGDIEHRDLWEYRLDFEDAEIARLLRHVWELRAAFFDYYFFDENCSYHLLSLLEAARPSLQLTDRFTWWAIPADTVHETVDEPGLLDAVTYRPSPTIRLRRRYDAMDSSVKPLALSLAEGTLDPKQEIVRGLASRDQAKILEFAVDYLIYRKAKGTLGEAEWLRRSHELLVARSRLGVPSQMPPIAAPKVRPDQGHPSRRAGIGYGLEDGRHFLRLELRPAYHDLLDPQGGYPPGAQIQFLNLAVRIFPDTPDAQLDRIDAIDVVSLSPWTSLMQPVSWRVSFGAARKRFADGENPLVGHLQGGIGVSAEPFPNTLAFAFAQGAVNISSHLNSFAALGFGPSIGVLHDVTDAWRVGLTAEAGHFFFARSPLSYAVHLRQRVTLAQDSAVRLDLYQERDFGGDAYGGALMWYLYF